VDILRFRLSSENDGTTANKMFAQWWRDVNVLSTFILLPFAHVERTRLRKGTTAETQTLPAIGRRQTDDRTTHLIFTEKQN
jgi:hypothetical protein